MSIGSYVLVGYDGTTESENALRWGAREAGLRHLPLTVCHAWRWPFPISHIDIEGTAIVKRMGEHVLDHGVTLAERFAPGVKVSKRLLDGPAYAALMHLTEDAALVVIGSHEQDALPVGSTALRLPARARRPIVVVRGAESRYGDGEVVVGVDGSVGADAALAFAFEEAALRDRRLRAVYGCWEPTAAPDCDLSLFDDEDKLRRVCGARLECQVAPWRVRYPQVDAWTSLLLKPPRQALFEAAENAALVVVGNRGLGGLEQLCLGATSSAVLQHVPCAVAVVQPLCEPGQSDQRTG
ncbi:universal stress protein [Spirillospora sp. NPDC048911]|uniref:universal stress protein n=1 Tax=Spirillospora sp. NPDC048911 TaxID=3364527 RepID=UPI003712A802